jgi:filamentous hemagglutinin
MHVVVTEGAGNGSDVTVTGSQLSAGRNAFLRAEGDVNLQGTQSSVSVCPKHLAVIFVD